MAEPQKLDVYVALVRLNETGYSRPCVVIETPQRGRILVAPISSAMDLYSSSQHFLLNESEPDFAQTGLDRTSFVVGDNLQELKTERLVKKDRRYKVRSQSALRLGSAEIEVAYVVQAGASAIGKFVSDGYASGCTLWRALGND